MPAFAGYHGNAMDCSDPFETNCQIAVSVVNSREGDCRTLFGHSMGGLIDQRTPWPVAPTWTRSRFMSLSSWALFNRTIAKTWTCFRGTKHHRYPARRGGRGARRGGSCRIRRAGMKSRGLHCLRVPASD